jgi:hypothetical protein
VNDKQHNPFHLISKREVMVISTSLKFTVPYLKFLGKVFQKSLGRWEVLLFVHVLDVSILSGSFKNVSKWA